MSKSTLRSKVLISTLLFFITGICLGQTKGFDLDSYKGTWIGVATKQIKGEKRISQIIWRIHNINNLKNEIEITELNQHFDYPGQIYEPKKRTYAGKISNDKLCVSLKDSVGDDIKIVLYLFEQDGSRFLQNANGQFNKYIFSLGKINNDTSIYVKPKDSVKVTVVRSGIL